MSRLPERDADRLADYLSGELRGEERAKLEEEILDRDDLAEAFYGEKNLEEAIEVTRREKMARREGFAIFRPRGRWKSRDLTWKIALPMAAVLATLFFLPRPEDTSRPTFRSPESPLTLHAPTEVVDDVPRDFSWIPDPEAARYRIEISDLEARFHHEALTDEPRYVVPAEVDVAGWRGGFWKVTSLDENGFPLRSSDRGRLGVGR